MIIINTVKLLKALGDETRFNIVSYLLKNNLCVGALADMLGISKSATSQQLKLLRESGLVVGEKRGYFTHYIVDKDALKNLSKAILELSELQLTITSCNDNKCCNERRE